MTLARWWPLLSPLPGGASIGALDVDAQGWVAVASDVAAAGGQLLALWTTLKHDSDAHATVHAALLAESRVLVPTLRLPAAADSYPGLQDLFLWAKSFLTRILKVTVVYFHSYTGM